MMGTSWESCSHVAACAQGGTTSQPYKSQQDVTNVKKDHKSTTAESVMGFCSSLQLLPCDSRVCFRGDAVVQELSCDLTAPTPHLWVCVHGKMGWEGIAGDRSGVQEEVKLLSW